MRAINTPDGLFHQGNPATGERGSYLSADWLNAVQSELIGVIRAAGLTPSATDNTQVLQALRILFSGTPAAPTLSGFTHTVPAQVTVGQSYQVVFSGTTASNGGTVLYRIQTPLPAGTTFSKLTGIAVGEAVTMTISAAAVDPAGGSRTVGVQAYVAPAGGGADVVNAGFGAIFTASAATPAPVTVSGFQHNVPSGMTAGQSVGVAFWGASASNGESVHYEISGGVGASFSKTSGIAANESVTLTIGGSTTGAVAFYVHAVSSSGAVGAQNNVVVTVQAAAAPTISWGGFWKTHPSSPSFGTTIALSFGGAAASDGSAVVYEIIPDPGPAGTVWTFSKLTGIADGEVVQATVPSVSSSNHFSLVGRTANGGYSFKGAVTIAFGN